MIDSSIAAVVKPPHFPPDFHGPVDIDGSPTPARRGRLGACYQCQESAASHFDTTGRFLGCARARDAETLFVLVPVTAESPRRVRKYRYYYRAVDPVGVLRLSDQREAAARAVYDAGSAGVLARDIGSVTGLSHGSVQQALAWLREHHVIDAREVPGGE